MGLTPLEGVIMGTRSGDIDPAICDFICQKEGLTPAEMNKILNKEVRYWHLVVFVVIAAVGVFYITRTGNSGTASATELAIRQWLEDTLYIRPRTKEFLIGFPIFVTALYAMSINRKLGSILLIPGVIGFLSIMNTFTHTHCLCRQPRSGIHR